MRIKRTHVAAAVIVLVGMPPILVGAAEIAWGTPPGSRIDDMVFANWTCVRCGDVPWGDRTVGDNASCRPEAWFEDIIGWRTPLVRGHEWRAGRTMDDMRTIATVCESFSIDHVDYPRAESLEALSALVVPRYAEAIATHDGWGRPLAFTSDAQGYRIASRGADGRWERAGLQHPRPYGFDAPSNRQLLGDLLRRLLVR